MKTTLDLNDRLVVEAKALAVRQRTTLTCLVEDGLKLRLQQQQVPLGAVVSLPVYRGTGGLMPGIDGFSNKAMLEAADSDA